MLLRYIGRQDEIDLNLNQIYKAKKINDELGDGYAIFDEGEDWYRYGVSYVKKNFEEVEETPENLKLALQ